MNGGAHLRELTEHEYVCELLSEKFDNAIELMTPDSIVYGGATRDCIAGKELLGDLDIAVSRGSFSQIHHNFVTNPRWVSVINDEDSKGAHLEKPYEDKMSAPKAPLSGIVSFSSIHGQIVQIMTAKQSTKDGFMDALTLSQTVDICCCGIIMLSDGRVFETVVGAYEDCLNGVLRLNESSGHITAKSTIKRVKRLVDRGWKSEIDPNHLKRYVNKLEEKKPEKGVKLSNAFFDWKMS